MKKELVEEALTNIDDKYIEEALNYKKKKVVKFPDHSSEIHQGGYSDFGGPGGRIGVCLCRCNGCQKGVHYRSQYGNGNSG